MDSLDDEILGGNAVLHYRIFTVSESSFGSRCNDCCLFFVLVENIRFRCLGVPLEIVMPAEFHILILHVMTPCSLVGHDLYSAEPSFNSRSDVRL